MKKITAFILMIISVLFLLTGCTSQPLKLDANYYQSKLGPKTNVNETCVYDVSVVSNTPFVLKEVKNTSVQCVISQGTLTTTLTVTSDEDASKYGSGFLYTSTLVIKGKYVIDGTEQAFEDKVTSKTYIKEFFNNLQPYYSEKYVKSSTLTNSDGYKVFNYEYSYNVTYNDKNAIVETNVIKDDTNSLTALKGKLEYSNYSNGAFVENELILFIPRTFDLTSDYYQAFKTLDVVSRKLQPMKYFTTTSTEGVIVKPIQLPTYTYNNELQSNKNVICAMLNVEIDDIFKGAGIEAYYATDHTEMRHLLVEFYTKLNNDLGYLKYTLKEVSFSD